MAAVLKGKATMFKRKNSIKIAIVLAVLVVLLLGYASILVQRDLRLAKIRLAQPNSQLIQMACGPIEYLESGSGVPVLVVHKAGVGFD